MRPAKLHMGAAALIVAPVLAALALLPAAQRTSGGSETPAPQAGTGLAGAGLVTAAEAREAPAPQVPAIAPAPAETEKRTVRVILDSPFGPPPDVVVTTEPAKPPVYAPEPGKSHARLAEAAPDPQEKPRPKKKKKPRRAPGLEQFAGPALSSPFFAFTR
ncbi:hypothetical protein NK718_21075 [Alsobacter sp. SYSU M60028]|uniref:Uncharacterized protein n=1 Tax=Alsobacter ponti TaxID=2962936 RepID=A0ABT1LHP5_9HYPH|nr:hypothetical protein [Alsobacter ponti]MCP8941025.1 hypothetical protein [Alsobacter ponti]